MIIRMLAVVAGVIAFFAMFLIGLFFVIPFLLAGGATLYFYLRRHVRQARPSARDDVIEVEYTVIERRHQNS